MDRNSAIGLTLIAVLLLAYFYWFSPQPQEPASQTANTETPAPSVDSANHQAPIANDSLLAATYGDLSSVATGSEALTTVETEDLRIVFSNKGGIIRELELKKYKTYSQQPLKLIAPERTSFKLLSNYDGKEIDLYSLFYKPDLTKKNDTTVLTFRVQLANGSALTQTYAIPAQGYEINYGIQQQGIAQHLKSENLTFLWDDKILPLEKDLQDTRINTTITYYSNATGFDQLSERST